MQSYKIENDYQIYLFFQDKVILVQGDMGCCSGTRLVDITEEKLNEFIGQNIKEVKYIKMKDDQNFEEYKDYFFDAKIVFENKDLDFRLKWSYDGGCNDTNFGLRQIEMTYERYHSFFKIEPKKTSGEDRVTEKYLFEKQTPFNQGNLVKDQNVLEHNGNQNNTNEESIPTKKQTYYQWVKSFFV